MKTKLKTVLTWLGLSLILMVLWISGIFIGNLIFPSDLMNMSADSEANSGILFLIVCLVNAGLILFLILNSRFRKWELVIYVFLITFGIQYFMSQIETIWFNDSLKLPENGIWAIISGGAITTLFFSIIAIWLTGRFKSDTNHEDKMIIKFNRTLIIRASILSIIVWPIIYFLAGYFIAWQFADLRLFYSGTTDIEPFFSMMKANISSGLYSFQFFRGFAWVIIGLMVLNVSKGTPIQKGILLGLLFAILGGSGLILPNPVMPFMVRMGHLTETVPSNFIWGLIIALTLAVETPAKRNSE